MEPIKPSIKVCYGSSKMNVKMNSIKRLVLKIYGYFSRGNCWGYYLTLCLKQLKFYRGYLCQNPQHLDIFVLYVVVKFPDVTKAALTPAPDFLLQNLKNATSPRTVLGIVNDHYSIMNNKHMMQALRSLFDLQKCGSSDVQTKDILCHPDFNKLCRKLKSQSGVIELNETIEAMKVIAYLGVPSSSTIVQVLLQLIRQNINFLNLPQIMFLDFLLSQFKSSPLVDALKIALPIVFEINLPIKMDRDNVIHLAEYLYFASKTNLSENAVDIIIQALCQFRGELDAQTAKSIIWSITNMYPKASFQQILTKAVNDLIVCIDDLSYSELETTLTKLNRKYNKRFPFYYQEILCDTCANYVIDHDLGFKHSLYVLKKLGRISHVNNNLLDYLSKKVYENPNNIIDADPSDIYSIAISASLSNYKPIHWEVLKDLIKKKKNLSNETKREIIWIRFAASLCLLDIYKIDIVSKALDINYLTSLFKKGFMSDFENYFVIWQSITMHRPELTDILPSKFDPEQVIENVKGIPDFPLEASLQKGLGGDQYIMSNLVSKKGHQIDHAVLFRKGGYAVPFEKKVKFIEDIEVKEHNELLLILALQSIHYMINTGCLREAIALSIRVLELNGYNVIAINLDLWNSLMDFEKIPYLMQSIKQKMDHTVFLSESVV